MLRANFIMVQPSTPAQYFHALRRQASSPHTKPLVVLTPKTLLHHKHCVSKLLDFAPRSSFRRVIADGDAGDDVTRHEHIPLKPTSEIKRVIFCTGKIYYQLARQRLTKKIDDVALVRVEQLFPFPHDALARRIQRYPNAHFVWAQEEPKNMGYWAFVAPRIATTMRISRALNDAGLRFIGRPPSAAPATGSLAIHNAENSRIIAQALDSSDDAML
jgi:2-oxoglutarate dehydrogenase E1 component